MSVSQEANNRKRALRAALDDLEELVEEERVDQGAYLKLSKRLKEAHDAENDAEDKVTDSVRTGLCIEYAVQNPSTLRFAPDDVETREVSFVSDLLLARQKEDEITTEGMRSAGMARAKVKRVVAEHTHQWKKYLIEEYLYPAKFCGCDTGPDAEVDDLASHMRLTGMEVLLDTSEVEFGHAISKYLEDEVRPYWTPCDMSMLWNEDGNIDTSSTRLARISNRYPDVVRGWAARCANGECERCKSAE